MNYRDFNDFMDELDRSGSLSDDPFDVDAADPLDEADLALIGGGKPQKPEPKPSKPTKKASKP